MAITIKFRPSNLSDLLKLIQKDLKAPLTPKDLVEIGEEVISEIKRSVDIGKSPVSTGGRFPAYKRGGDPDGYPNSVKKRYPNKRNRPVNLRLSGEFLDKALRYKTNPSKQALSIGFFDSKNAAKEQGHREGAKGQPKRPIIPQGSEKFSLQVTQRIVDLMLQAINKKLTNIK